jgi:hypothetical protein
MYAHIEFVSCVNKCVYVFISVFSLFTRGHLKYLAILAFVLCTVSLR